MSKTSLRRCGPSRRYSLLPKEKTSELIAEYDYVSNSYLLDKYGISKSSLRNIRIKCGLKSKDISRILPKKSSIKELMGVSGVYAIVRDDCQKAYFGSSTNVGARLKNHIYMLEAKFHINKDLQDDWAKHNFYFYLIDAIEESKLLEEEMRIASSLSKFCLYNKNFIVDNKDIPYASLWDEIKKKISISEDGCWIFTGKIKKGYGMIIFEGKELKTHRVSCILHSEQYPYLVHHICKNKACCNPLHLKSESFKGNYENHKKSSLLEHKEDIIDLRNAGKTYKQVREYLGLDVSVSAICRFCKKKC